MTCLLALFACLPSSDVRADASLELPDDLPVAGSFVSPVGDDGAGYYDAQPFGVNTHLGCDYNGVGGGNSDLGDPVYAAGLGEVELAEDLGGGWGNVVRLRHRLPDGSAVETIYAHLDELAVSVGDRVAAGERVGTIGTAGGQYLAHLHFEVRTEVGAVIGGGYGKASQGQIDPAAFLVSH